MQAILCAGLYPNVAATEEGITGTVFNSLKQSASFATKGRPVWYDGRREVHIHPSSVNNNSKAFEHPFLVFLEKVCTPYGIISAHIPFLENRRKILCYTFNFLPLFYGCLCD